MRSLVLSILPKLELPPDVERAALLGVNCKIISRFGNLRVVLAMEMRSEKR